jgi:hypothetical protein
MTSKRANKTLFMLLLCTSLLYFGCSLEQKREAPKIPTYVNSFQYCLPTAYAADVATLVPECKASPPGSTVYQLTTTVWVRRGLRPLHSIQINKDGR